MKGLGDGDQEIHPLGEGGLDDGLPVENGKDLTKRIAGSLSEDEVLSEYKKYIPILMGYARKLTDTKEDAEDLMQETFIKIWKFHYSYRPKNFKAWAMKILYNKFVDIYRSKKIRSTTGASSVDHNDYMVECGSAVTSSVENQMMLEFIKYLISLLPEANKIPLAMKIEGKKDREIAEELGLTISNTKARIMVGRKKLKRLCETYGVDLYQRYSDLDQET